MTAPVLVVSILNCKRDLDKLQFQFYYIRSFLLRLYKPTELFLQRRKKLSSQPGFKPKPPALRADTLNEQIFKPIIIHG